MFDSKRENRDRVVRVIGNSCDAYAKGNGCDAYAQSDGCGDVYLRSCNIMDTPCEPIVPRKLGLRLGLGLGLGTIMPRRGKNYTRGGLPGHKWVHGYGLCRVGHERDPLPVSTFQVHITPSLAPAVRVRRVGEIGWGRVGLVRVA